MDRRRLGGSLARELHLDIPGLVDAAISAMEQCPDLEPLNQRRAAEYLACRIEDLMGYSGHFLFRELTPEAFKDWRGIVARKFDKVLKAEAASAEWEREQCYKSSCPRL